MQMNYYEWNDLQTLLRHNTNETIYVKLTCDESVTDFDNITQNDCDIINGLQTIYNISRDHNETVIDLVGIKAGRQTLVAKVNDSNIGYDMIFAKKRFTIPVIGYYCISFYCISSPLLSLIVRISVIT